MDANTAPQEKATLFSLAEFDGMNMLEASYHRRRFPRHVHETFCVGVIETGAQRFWRSGGDHVAPSGDIILVNADEVHTGCSEVAGGWSYRAIYPHPDLFARLLAVSDDEPGQIPWFPDAVLHDPLLSAQLRLAFSLLPQPGNSLLKESLLLTAFSWLQLRYSRTRPQERGLAEARQAVLPAQEMMASCPEHNWSLQQLADLAGLSPWHFLRQFRKSSGMTPHAWLVQARLRQALNYSAPCLLTAICGPIILLQDGGLRSLADNPYLYGALAGVLIAALVRHMVLSVLLILLMFYAFCWLL